MARPPIRTIPSKGTITVPAAAGGAPGRFTLQLGTCLFLRCIYATGAFTLRCANDADGVAMKLRKWIEFDPLHPVATAIISNPAATPIDVIFEVSSDRSKSGDDSTTVEGTVAVNPAGAEEWDFDDLEVPEDEVVELLPADPLRHSGFAQAPLDNPGPVRVGRFTQVGPDAGKYVEPGGFYKTDAYSRIGVWSLLPGARMVGRSVTTDETVDPT